jgi:hypothetical protein
VAARCAVVVDVARSMARAGQAQYRRCARVSATANKRAPTHLLTPGRAARERRNDIETTMRRAQPIEQPRAVDSRIRGSEGAIRQGLDKSDVSTYSLILSEMRGPAGCSHTRMTVVESRPNHLRNRGSGVADPPPQCPSQEDG